MDRVELNNLLVKKKKVQEEFTGEFVDQHYKNVDFSASLFNKARLLRCTFTNCVFKLVTFKSCYFESTIFNTCDLTKAEFYKGEAHDLNLISCVLTDAIFDIRVKDCNLENVSNGEHVGWYLKSGVSKAKKLDFHNEGFQILVGQNRIRLGTYMKPEWQIEDG